MKTFIFLLLTATALTTTQASGNRELILNKESAEYYPELQLSALTKNLKYLGSSTQWHFFAETLTSVSGGMPFDNTYVYKIQKKALNIENPLLLNITEKNYAFHVPSCPTLRFDATKNTTVFRIKKDQNNGCMIN